MQHEEVMTPRLRTLVCIAALSATAYAQDRGSAPASAGTVRPFVFNATPSNVRDSKATQAEVKAAEASARKLANLIAEVPALNPPVGFTGVLVGVLMGRDATQARLRPVGPLDVWVRFGAPRNYGDEVNFLHFYINDLRPVILDHLGARKWEDERGDFYLEPARTGEVGGFPMYNDLVVITRPGDSIWSPVPVERFARTLAAELKFGADDAEKRRNRARADLEEFLSPPEQQKRRAEIDAARQRSDAASEIHRLEVFFGEDEAAIRRKIDPDPNNPKDEAWYFGPVKAFAEIQTLIAGLDAAGRRAPSCVIGGETSDRWRMRVVPAGTAGCHRVVEANLGLLKPELPRSAIQLITVEDIKHCREELAPQKQKTVGDCAANLEVVRQLDWQRVAALLEK
jgi:hypothetical protein